MTTGRRGAPGAVAREIARIIGTELSDSHRTQTELAEAAGVSQSQVSKILRGEKHMDIDQMYGMCGALRLRVVEVIREAEAVADTRSRLRGPATGTELSDEERAAGLAALRKSAPTADDTEGEQTA